VLAWLDVNCRTVEVVDPGLAVDRDRDCAQAATGSVFRNEDQAWKGIFQFVQSLRAIFTNQARAGRISADLQRGTRAQQLTGASEVLGLRVGIDALVRVRRSARAAREERR